MKKLLLLLSLTTMNHMRADKHELALLIHAVVKGKTDIKTLLPKIEALETNEQNTVMTDLKTRLENKHLAIKQSHKQYGPCNLKNQYVVKMGGHALASTGCFVAAYFGILPHVCVPAGTALLYNVTRYNEKIKKLSRIETARKTIKALEAQKILQQQPFAGE